MSELPPDPPEPPDTPDTPDMPDAPDAPDEFGSAAEPAPAALLPLPFEDPSIPAMRGLFETVKLFTRHPHEAFERMNVTSDLLRPIVYALVLGGLGILVGVLMNLAIDEMLSKLPQPPEMRGRTFPRAFWLAYAAVSPLLLLVALALRAFILHCGLMLTGGAKRGLAATVRALCYAQTYAVAILVPICGWFVAGFWGIYLEVVGIKHAHGTTYGRAIGAYLVPMFLICTCAAIFFAMFGAAMMASMKNL